LEVGVATRFALPSQQFGDVQRYLRQKRATGQTVTPRESRLAWQAYFDTLSSRYHQSRELGMRQEQMDRNFALQEEALEREEDAARISGITQLASTGAMGAMALKGTSIGSKLGLGGAEAAKGGAQAAIGAVPSAATAAPWTVAGVEAGKTAAAGYAGAGTGTYAAAAGKSGLISAAAPFLAPGIASIGGGFIGSEIGEQLVGSDAGEVGGGLVGGAATGAAIGSFVPGVGTAIGAIVGGVIGGAVGAVKAIKD
jgi:hypothetical protein